MLFQIATINDDLADFDCLFNLWNQVNDREDDRLDVTFDFSKCCFLRQNAVAFLGGLACLVESRGGKASFDWNTLQPAIRENLKQNGFMYAFNGCNNTGSGNSIPYRQDRDPHRIPDYLARDWLGRGWVKVSQDLTNAIVSTVGEIYLNAFEHGRSDIGVFSCGQHYPNMRILKLTVVDFGVGIPSNVRIFRKNDTLPASEALQWAFRRGNTTRRGDVASGLGLDLLSKFVRMNKGSLEIFSHDGYVRIDRDGDTYSDRQTSFEGTMMNLTLQCDECCYNLTDELDDGPLF